MSRITGTVSRSIPLDSLLTRSLTLVGTFDTFVSEVELAAIRPTLDMLAASGILTNSNIFQQSDSLLQGVAGVGADAPLSTLGSAALTNLLTIPLLIPDAATTTYTYKTDIKIEVVDIVIRKSAAGAGNSIKMQDNAAADISDAIATVTDKAITRAGTIDPAKNVILAGSTFKLLCTRAAGSMLAQVWVHCVKR